jgi:hypothetical protein
MRLRFRPLASETDRIPVDGGPAGLALWQARLNWSCRGVPLALRMIGVEPIAVPDAEPSEPVPGAIARVVRAVAGNGALVLLENPDVALGVGQIAFAEGVRLFSIAAPADEACWDALLTLGQPCYGVRDEVVVEVVNPRPASIISALAFGVFYCHDGLEPLSLDEDREGVRWRTAVPTNGSVIGRGGFELASSTGSEGAWADRGNEGSVRVVLRSPVGSCWTQPRFIAPRAGACHG